MSRGQLLDRSVGCILGLAIGDALGCPVEGFSPGQIQQIYGQLRDFSQPKVIFAGIAEQGLQAAPLAGLVLRRWRLPGLYSDDTQQALLLIDSLLAAGGADADDFARRILHASRPATTDTPLGAFRGYGSGFLQAVRNLSRGVPARQAGTDSAGNGAAMRIAPVGLYYAGRDEEIVRAALEISLVTHRDARSLAGAAAVALAVSQAISLKPPCRAGDFLQQLIPRVQQAERHIEAVIADRDEQSYHQFSDALQLLTRLVNSPAHEAFAAIADNARKATSVRPINAHHPFVLASVVSSFWCFLHHIDSLEEAICQAINGGGDTDTIGAITAALAGALHGSNSIPRQWVTGLINAQQVRLRAEALAGNEQAKDQLANFYEMELELTRQCAAAGQRARVLAQRLSPTG